MFLEQLYDLHRAIAIQKLLMQNCPEVQQASAAACCLLLICLHCSAACGPLCCCWLPATRAAHA